MDDLIERLAEGVRLVGLNEDDSVELYDIEDANEAMFEAKARIAALEAELERRKYDGDHTCHEHCPRPACVLRREKAALEAEVARLMGLVKEAGEALEAIQQRHGWCPKHCRACEKAVTTLAKIKETPDA